MKKTFLITGATKGIGLATSLKLKELGHEIVGIARNQPKEPFPGTLFPCDLSDTAQTEQTLAKIHEKYSLDGVVNNVRLVLPEPFGEIQLDSLQQVYQVNVQAAVQIA